MRAARVPDCRLTAGWKLCAKMNGHKFIIVTVDFADVSSHHRVDL
jgi:hypothetical protein